MEQNILSTMIDWLDWSVIHNTVDTWVMYITPLSLLRVNISYTRQTSVVLYVIEDDTVVVFVDGVIVIPIARVVQTL